MDSPEERDKVPSWAQPLQSSAMWLSDFWHPKQKPPPPSHTQSLVLNSANADSGTLKAQHQFQGQQRTRLKDQSLLRAQIPLQKDQSTGAFPALLVPRVPGAAPGAAPTQDSSSCPRALSHHHHHHQHWINTAKKE